MAQEILVSINVNSGKAEVGLNNTTKGVNKLEAAKKKLNYELSEEAKELARVNAAIKDQQLANKKAVASNIQYANSVKSINKNGKQLRTNAGLNNAIIAESARLASDASYGYTAIANNLGQLISLFSASANAAGGLKSAIGALFTIQSAFLIGIQLLITYGDDIYNFFVGSASAIDEEREALEKDNEELERNIKLRELYNRAALTTTRALAREIRDVFFSNIDGIEQQERKLNALGTLLEERGVKNAKLVKDETIALDARLLIAEKILEAEEVRIKQSEVLGKLKENELTLADLEQQKDERKRKFTGDFEKEQKKALAILNRDIRSEKDIISGRLGALARYEGELSNISNKIEELKKRGIVLTPDEEKEGKRQRRYIRKFLDFTAKIEAARLVARTKTISREEDIIKESGSSEIKLLQERTNRFIEVQKQRLKDRLITDKQYRDSEIQAYNEFETARVAIAKKTDVLLNEIALRRQQTANEIDLRTFRQREANELELSLITERIEGKRAKSRIDLQQRVVDQEISSIQSRLNAGSLEVDERAKLELELTKKQKEQAGIRMKIADAEANAKIQSFEVTANALTAFSKLAGEDTKAGKALAASGALISTYLSAQKAFESQFKPLATVDSPVRGAIAAAAAVASGLANVKAILSVDASGTNSVGAKPAPVQAPAFNVVGASATNQLAQAVSNNVPQVLPVAFESDLSDALDVNDSNTGADTVGQRSIG